MVVLWVIIEEVKEYKKKKAAADGGADE